MQWRNQTDFKGLVSGAFNAQLALVDFGDFKGQAQAQPLTVDGAVV